VAAVDPDDDGIQRYVVRRYAYDPKRHERRHQVIAAFDNQAECLGLLRTLAGDLQRRRVASEPIDRLEHYTSLTLEPGYRRRQQDAGYAPLHEPGLDDVLRDILAKQQDVGCTVTACDPVAATTAARLLQNTAVADDPSAGVNDVNA
jgi:hypothetical protein